MPYPCYSAETLDDLLRMVMDDLPTHGQRISPSKGDATELSGVLLELKNPRARLSRTETRGMAFSCLGELCWYLAKDNKLEFIKYYLRKYEDSADGDIIFGAYGPRLFDWDGLDQFERAIDRLKKNPASRKAMIQLFDRRDLDQKHNDVPCTCTMQFLVRDGVLTMIVYMRSNDITFGMVHDFFAFTMLQEIMAAKLSLTLGSYKHMVGSLHLYDKNNDRAKNFLSEGWQPTEIYMPEMPKKDLKLSIEKLLEVEAQLRLGQPIGDYAKLDPYWKDLIILLEIFAATKLGEKDRIPSLAANLQSVAYKIFVQKHIA